MACKARFVHTDILIAFNHSPSLVQTRDPLIKMDNDVAMGHNFFLLRNHFTAVSLTRLIPLK